MVVVPPSPVTPYRVWATPSSFVTVVVAVCGPFEYQFMMAAPVPVASHRPAEAVAVPNTEDVPPAAAMLALMVVMSPSMFAHFVRLPTFLPVRFATGVVEGRVVT